MLLEGLSGPNRASVPQINRYGACNATPGGNRSFSCKLCCCKYAVNHNFLHTTRDSCSTSCIFCMVCAVVRMLIWVGFPSLASPLVFASNRVCGSAFAHPPYPPLYTPPPNDWNLRISGTGSLWLSCNPDGELLFFRWQMAFVKILPQFDPSHSTQNSPASQLLPNWPSCLEQPACGLLGLSIYPPHPIYWKGIFSIPLPAETIPKDDVLE